MRLFCAFLLASCAAIHLSRAATQPCFGGFADAEPAQPLRPAQPQTWAQLEAGCAAAHVGHTLLRFVDALSDAERAACGNVVPYGVYEEIVLRTGLPPVRFYWSGRHSQSFQGLTQDNARRELEFQDLANLTYVPHGTSSGVAAIDLTTGRWGIVPKTQTFKCALCQKAWTNNPDQLYPQYLPYHMTFLYMLDRAVFEIVLVGEEKSSFGNTSFNDHELLSLKDELCELFNLGTNEVSLSLSENNHRGSHEHHFYMIQTSTFDTNKIKAIEDRFNRVVHQTLAGRYEVIRVRLISPCPIEDYPDGYQPEFREVNFQIDWRDPKLAVVDDVQVLVNPELELVSQRECVWDNATSALAWTPRIYWRLLWRNNSDSEHLVECSFVPPIANPLLTKQMEKPLNSLMDSSLNCSDLDEVADVVNSIVLTINELPRKTLVILYSLLDQTIPKVDTGFCHLEKERLHLLVSNLEASKPVIGFRIKLPLVLVFNNTNNVEVAEISSTPAPTFSQSIEIYGDSNYHAYPNLQTPSASFGNMNDSYSIHLSASGPTSMDENSNYPAFPALPTSSAYFGNMNDSYGHILSASDPTSMDVGSYDQFEHHERTPSPDSVKLDAVDKFDVMRQSLNTTDPSTEFALVVSDDLVAEFQKLAIAVVARVVYSINFGSTAKTFERIAYIELSTTNQLSSLYLDDDGYYIDITYQYFNATGERKGERILTSCVAWNSLTEAWTTMACRERKSLQDSLTVCRCRAKHMTQNGGTLTGTFALKKAIDSPVLYFATSMKEIYQYVLDNNVLIALTVIELFLSSFGLLSFVLTAICCKQWSEDLGHKILMHMVLAITLNLGFGFTTDYVHLDTESVGCIAIGVVRHYSFLAMFMWMLVLSGLQMKRLMTVAGAKATSHLILKVALFAWGVPLLPIVFILAWNTRIYRSDRYDRGYCYPEGIVFQLTVQAPAGLILLVNLLIFVVIVRHIFECGAGEKITKHSKNEKAQQMRRVATSIFIFFLFGFTWVLHYLSEQRVIKSDFLFEYLFLMTATTHISVLSLFFVILDDKVRAFWLQIVKGSGPATTGVTNKQMSHSQNPRNSTKVVERNRGHSRRSATEHGTK